MRIVVLLIVLSVACSGQVLLEVAAGALIGTAAGISGKMISDEFDRAFTKAGKTWEKAVAEVKGTAPVKRQSGGAAARPKISAAAAPARGQRPAPAPEKASPRAPATEAVPSLTLLYPSAVPTVPFVSATAETFAQVKKGVTSRELIATLGPPAAKVSLPEEGRVVEIYRYSAEGVELGTIRVVNGAVVEVRAAR